ncbi:MAG TPA: Uma2 family endonuclease [Gemmataceae bacterium]|nr:Uma2 family endonuclease [Gemmataceae bacterium]
MNRAGRSTSKNGKSRRAEQPDPFRFGWRYVQQIAADGSKESVRVPLTLDDVLHPQEGDEIPDNSQQGRDCNYLYSVLKWRLADNPHAVVFSDCLVNWGVRGLRNPSPDISVFDGVADPNRIWRTFAVAREGARPVLVIEIVSPDAHDRQARDNDVVIKVREYYRARVPIYALVDQEEVEGSRRIVGYRRGSRKYVPLPLDEQGRLLLEPVRLLMGLRDERVICWDADTGEEIADFAQLAQAHQQTEAARLAEAQARQQAEARLLAETQARQEAEAARIAETQARLAETQARQATETALADALARIRELEARPRTDG